MDWCTLKDAWTGFHEAMLQRWPDLTENDLIRASGDRAEFEALVARRTGQDIDSARDDVADWLAGAVPADVRADPAFDDRAMRASGAYVPAGEDPSDDDARFGDDDQADRPMGRTDG